MQKYTIFWIEQEFCYHYFYKSEILFRFLNEYMNNNSRNDLQSQFDFITKSIPYSNLVTHIQRFHGNQIELKVNGRKIDLIKNNNKVTLYLKERSMIIKCTSVQEADFLLFGALKMFDPSFFIVENGSTNSGWITPVKKEALL
ncbi:sporulation inhibitor of replication protein SirA [Aquibacillus kalidii]|uniref:sporulation inhibitor of replication protein SirA n=1 Tax=Aquibacillus kalidii TaxID=2762597 RepID=UPI0016463E20|nr:sporulation inhibitor of replication protein SirA [Aquibacillus kalidii]